MNNLIGIENYTLTHYFSFNVDNVEVGKFWIENGVAKFEGNASESAQLFSGYVRDYLQADITKAVTAEREACIAIVAKFNIAGHSVVEPAIQAAIAEIRARGNQ